MPTFNSTAWHAVVAPAGTPRSVVLRLQQTFQAAVAAPELKKSMAASDVELVASSPAELGKFLRMENDKWSKVIRSAGIKIN
jgi:tripartite-type tricarboxylate transporter receptor subunit TctC